VAEPVDAADLKSGGVPAQVQTPLELAAKAVLVLSECLAATDGLQALLLSVVASWPQLPAAKQRRILDLAGIPVAVKPDA
jgi:hypothetical protein